MINGEALILRSGCGVAEFLGTSGSPRDILKSYAESRNLRCHADLGSTNAHTFVVMSTTGKAFETFNTYLRKYKLGTSVKTKKARNLNHGGWGSQHGTMIQAMLYQPDHEKLTEWYQKNFDKDYELKTINE